MKIRNYCSFIYDRKIQIAILVLITLNAISLGIETNRDLSPSFRNSLELFDSIALYLYVVELMLKQMASGLKFWKDGWNIFDFIVVAISFIPAGSTVSVLRGFRILRVLRLLSSLKALRTIVTGLLLSLPSIGWLSLLMMIVFYLFAVMGTNFFGEDFPEFFGSLGKSSYTLFQIMTLESWSMGIARPVIAHFQYAYLYFVIFIMINTFIMLNLFVGVIVNAMGYTPEESSSDEIAELADSDRRTKELSAHITKVKQALEEANKSIIEIEAKIKKMEK